ncbi:MAG: hypothetical protein LBT23_05315 [Synergistaceae bacterium]|nr:hypothetical protein [Synergistaceae bacterium]
MKPTRGDAFSSCGQSVIHLTLRVAHNFGHYIHPLAGKIAAPQRKPYCGVVFLSRPNRENPNRPMKIV